MRVYISGPMTGKPDNNIPAFAEAARLIIQAGHTPMDPARLSLAFGSPDELAAAFREYYASKRSDYTSHPNADRLWRINLARAVQLADLAALETCDAICLLDDWHNSIGARKELQEALERDLDIRFIQDFKPAEAAR